VGFSRDFNEIWSILVDVGLRHTWSEVFQTILVPLGPSTLIAVRERSVNNVWSGVGSLSLHYKGEYWYGDLTCATDLTPAPGLNGAAEHNAITLSTQYRLTYELSALLTTGYYTFKSGPSNVSAQIIDQKTFFINPGVRYEFSRDIAAEASYGYARVSCPASSTGVTVDCPASNTIADRHSFSISLQFQHSFLE
jgi:hypothetical protein